MDQLLRWCAEYGCAVVCVMHENKAADDTALKGHLGTLLGQKLAEQYSVKREDVDGEERGRAVFHIEMSETRSGHRIVPRTAEFDDEGHFAPSRYEPPRYDVEFGRKVRNCFVARQTTSLAPKDLYAELESQYGLKKCGSVQKRVAELEGYVFTKVGSNVNTKYILMDEVPSQT